VSAALGDDLTNPRPPYMTSLWGVVENKSCIPLSLSLSLRVLLPTVSTS
jgi:hypothetical protein